MEESKSIFAEAVRRFRDRREELRKHGIFISVPHAVEEIEEILWKLAGYADPDLVKKVYLTTAEEDNDLVEFVRERIRNLQDQIDRLTEAREAIREYMYENEDRLIDWILQKIFGEIS